MNVMRKLPWSLLLIVACVLALAAAGCGGDDDSTDTSGTPSESGTTDGGTGARRSRSEWSPTRAGSPTGGSTSSRSTASSGRRRSLASSGRIYTSKSADDYLPNLTAAVDDGHDLVVGIGFLIQPSIVEVATEATDVNFAGIDQFYGEEPDCGGENQAPCALPNVLGLQFPSEESGYLAGIVAAMMSKTGTVSTVGGISIPPVNNWIAGFRQAVKDTNPDVKLLNAYSQDFVDQAKCKEIALDQIAQGSDVVFQVAGDCGLGALDAACEKGVMAIGVDADQSFAGDCVITSGLKPLELAVFETIKAAQDGTFEGGTNRFFGIEEFPDAELLAPFSDAVPQEVQDAVEEAKQKLISGEIDPPATLD